MPLKRLEIVTMSKDLCDRLSIISRASWAIVGRARTGSRFMYLMREWVPDAEIRMLATMSS